MLKRLLVFVFILAFIISVGLTAAAIFLKPVLKEIILHTAEENLGSKIELSNFGINLLRGIIFLEGLKVRDIRPIKYFNFTSADEIMLDIDLPATILKRNLIFQKISVRNFTFRLKSIIRPYQPLETEPRAVEAAQPRSYPHKNPFAVYIKKFIIRDSIFVYEDYSVSPPLSIELTGVNGRFQKLSIPSGEDGLLKGDVLLSAQLSPPREGALSLEGSFVKIGEEADFNLTLRLEGVNLTGFSRYYSQTSFKILKEAKLDLHSEAACRKNRLNAVQNVRIYDIELDKIMPKDKDKLFGLPAKTVIDFFSNLKGDVNFSFNVVGTIDDPQFDPGPVVQNVIQDALREKIGAVLRELPRDVIKMGKKAIRGGLGDGEDGGIGEKLKGLEKKLKNIIDY